MVAGCQVESLLRGGNASGRFGALRGSGADLGADRCQEASDEPFEYGPVRLGDHVSQRGLGGAGECRGALDVARA